MRGESDYALGHKRPSYVNTNAKKIEGVLIVRVTIYDGTKDTVYIDQTGDLKITIFKYSNSRLRELSSYAVSFEEPNTCIVVFNDEVGHVGFQSNTGSTIVQLPLGPDEIAAIEDIDYVVSVDTQNTDCILATREDGEVLFLSELPKRMLDDLLRKTIDDLLQS